MKRKDLPACDPDSYRDLEASGEEERKKIKD